MNKGFFKIAEIKIAHEYFQGTDGFTTNFVLESKTLEIITRFGFIIDRGRDYIKVFLKTDSSVQDYLKYITTTTGTQKFTFNLETNDEEFYYYTNLPLDSIGQILYSTKNKEVNTVLVEKEFIPSETNFFAQVELLFEDLNDEEDSSVYQINLEARKTQWNYYIINQSDLNFENLRITGEGDVIFSDSEEVVLPNGQSAFLFSSGENLLTMTTLSLHSFNLIDRVVRNSSMSDESHKDKMIRKGLPNPSPINTQSTNNHGDVIATSPIYIYV